MNSRPEELQADRQCGGDRALAPAQYGASERLNYLADMILELKHMAEKSGCLTLAGILSLAHAEACHQAEARQVR
jgi:hypothetical protein